MEKDYEGKPESLSVENVNYIREDLINTNQPAEKLDGLEYCIIRTYSAGVHIGFVKSRENQEISLVKSRRLHYWVGACSLSQAAMEGVDFSQSRVAMELPQITLTDCIEIIPCSEKAMKLFQRAKIWKN